jgi:hypothetical protein
MCKERGNIRICRRVRSTTRFKKPRQKHFGTDESDGEFRPEHFLDQSYYFGRTPGLGAISLPIGKRKERKKTETFKRGETGQTDL